MPTLLRRPLFASFALAALFCAVSAAAVSITLHPAVISNANPTQIAVARDGTIWSTSQTECTVTGYDPETLSYRWFLTLFDPGTCPLFVTAGPDGGVWFTQPNANRVSRYDPTAADFLQTVDMPTHSATPYGIAYGPDGAVWVTEYNSGKLARIEPWLDPWNATEFSLPVAGGHPANIVVASNGMLWTTLSSGNRLASFSPFDHGSDAQPVLPTANALPFAIAPGADAVYFTQQVAGKIGRIAHDGTFDEFTVPTPNALVYGITSAADGNVWFTEYSANKIGRMTPAGVFTEYSLPAGTHPMGIASDFTGHVWFAANGTDQIGKITLNVVGDPNADGIVNVGDVFYLINFLFAGGPAPKS